MPNECAKKKVDSLVPESILTVVGGCVTPPSSPFFSFFPSLLFSFSGPPSCFFNPIFACVIFSHVSC